MSSPKRRDSLREAVAAKTRQIKSLTGQLAAARAELANLNEELTALDRDATAHNRDSLESRNAALDTAAGRVSLFRSLFRGRADLYALEWKDRRGRTGYSPACDNKFRPGVCNIREVPCGRCGNQSFKPLDEQAVYAHLTGPDVIGLYPLLPDNTCWLLAADFDGKSWDRDVAAFRDACRAEGVPVAIERSRSGNGGHAWIFFSQPVAAIDARRMGSFLITRAISARHTVDFSSYDRLFPNQDSMPKGGFGNLIALPLQHGPRRSGNSMFVDDDLVPFSNQWEYLAGIERMPAAKVEQIAERAHQSGQVLGLGTGTSNRPDNMRRLAGSSPGPRTSGAQLPSSINAVLDSKLRIPKAGLPSPVLSGLKRLAAFQNPEYYKRERMRLSVALTPRVIRCFGETRTHLELPRGCTAAATEFLKECGTKLQVTDRRESGSKIDAKFWGALTPDQAESQRAPANSETGILVAPPGSGKTVVAISLIASRKRNTLVLVNRGHLLDQWVNQLALFLDIEPEAIGRIGGGVRRKTGIIDVAMFQSVVRMGQVSDLIDGYGQVIVDECHHVSAFSYERVLSQVRSRFVAGFTATPRRRDGQDPITRMQMGPIVWESKADHMAAGLDVERKLIVRKTGFEYDGPDPEPPIQTIYGALQSDERRNELITSDIAKALSEGRSPIVLTERHIHLDLLAERLRKLADHVVVLKGGASAGARRKTLASLAGIRDDESRVLLAIGRYIGEGFDDSRLDTLFLTMPISWHGVVVQYTGRLNRPYPGKTELRVYDYADIEVPMLAGMFRRRLPGFRTVGFSPA